MGRAYQQLEELEPDTSEQLPIEGRQTKITCPGVWRD